MNSTCRPVLAGRILTRAALFSALFLGSLVATRAADDVNFITFGDWGCGSPEQKDVAKGLAKYVSESGIKFDATLLLGDNFYTHLKGPSDPLWTKWFEEMYDAKALPMPFYALLGNHDCEGGGTSAKAELAYPTAHPESRWKMPSNYYRQDFPADKPLVSIIMLDGNIGGKEMAAQNEWLKAELAKDRPKWLIAASHFPLWSNSRHGDALKLRELWGPLLEKAKVDLYLAGHEHNQQHLQIATNFTSFITAGAGGKSHYGMVRDDRGPFTCSEHGFTHIHLTPDIAELRFLNTKGETLHLFTRTLDGKVEIKQTKGIEKASEKRNPNEGGKPAVDHEG